MIDANSLWRRPRCLHESPHQGRRRCQRIDLDESLDQRGVVAKPGGRRETGNLHDDADVVRRERASAVEVEQGLLGLATTPRHGAGDSMAQVVSSVLRDEPPASGGPAAVAEAIRALLAEAPRPFCLDG